MNTTGNTILITGGATGIGLALAEAFLDAGNEVIICGRRENRLLEAKSQFPMLHTLNCDVVGAENRRNLMEEVLSKFPKLNMLVNNAGIQREIDFRKGAEALEGENEIEVNLQAPVHLSALFIPHLMQQREAAILNVSSGLAFIPIAIMPLYCATKAALHSFSLALRRQLRNTSIKVFEIIPPTVDTELDKGRRDARGQTDRGIDPREVARETMPALQADEYEIAIGQAQFIRKGSREDPEGTFQRMNSRW
ncbi:MAG: SDR family NAD(P)-dependent oxidoreductase [Calditrichia bacterium]